MRTIILTAALTLTSFATQAQDFTAEQRAACKGDYETLCKAVMPGGGRVLACLSKESAKLSAACKKVVDAQKK